MKLGRPLTLLSALFPCLAPWWKSAPTSPSTRFSRWGHNRDGDRFGIPRGTEVQQHSWWLGGLSWLSRLPQSQDWSVRL